MKWLRQWYIAWLINRSKCVICCRPADFRVGVHYPGRSSYQYSCDDHLEQMKSLAWFIAS